MTAKIRLPGMLALAAATALTLAACGSGGDTDTAETTAAPTTTAAETTVTATGTDDQGAAADESGGAATDAGAGQGDENAPATDDTSAPSPHEEARAREAAYLADLDAVGVEYTTELRAIDAGSVTCLFLEQRRPYSEVVDYVNRNMGLDGRQAGAVARAAVHNFCPEQEAYANEAEADYRTGGE